MREDVVRYDLISDLGDGGEAAMEPRPNGDFVRAEVYDDLRKKLVKTAIKYATMWKNDGYPTPVETMIAVIYADCDVRLLWNEDEHTFEEDDR